MLLETHGLPPLIKLPSNQSLIVFWSPLAAVRSPRGPSGL